MQAVEKALRILEAMGDAGRPVGLGELSATLAMNPSTLYRLLVTLCRSGFVVHDPKAGEYRLSLKAFRLGQAALESIDLRMDARPIMEELVARCNESANLVVLQEAEAVFIEQVESSNMLRSMVRVGSRIPAHASAGGKVLLAALAPDALRLLYRFRPLVRCTANTITSFDALTQELAGVRERGYAVDDEELEAGVRCVGAPIRNHAHETVAALTVAGPAGRMSLDDIHDVLSGLVIEHAERISDRLGKERQVAVV